MTCVECGKAFPDGMDTFEREGHICRPLLSSPIEENVRKAEEIVHHFDQLYGPVEVHNLRIALVNRIALALSVAHAVGRRQGIEDAANIVCPPHRGVTNWQIKWRDLIRSLLKKGGVRE